MARTFGCCHAPFVALNCPGGGCQSREAVGKWCSCPIGGAISPFIPTQLLLVRLQERGILHPDESARAACDSANGKAVPLSERGRGRKQWHWSGLGFTREPALP